MATAVACWERFASATPRERDRATLAMEEAYAAAGVDRFAAWLLANVDGAGFDLSIARLAGEHVAGALSFDHEYAPAEVRS